MGVVPLEKFAAEHLRVLKLGTSRFFSTVLGPFGAESSVRAANVNGT
jgi:hypothetical protein